MEFEIPQTIDPKKQLSYSTGRQIFMYVISALLPPFGLGWAFKYYKSENPLGKSISITIFVITFVSLVLNVYLFSKFYNSYYSLIKSSSETQLLNELGY